MDTLQPIRIEYSKKYKQRIDLLFDDALMIPVSSKFNLQVSGQPAGVMPFSQPIRIKHS